MSELRSRIAACIADAEGRQAVERGTTLTLTKGQVGLLDQALQLLDVALAGLRQATP